MYKEELAIEIQDAIADEENEKVKNLINSDINMLNAVDPVLGTWLNIAASEGNLEIVKYFIDCGLDVNAESGSYDLTAIYEAAGEGYIEIVEYLLDCGAKMIVSESTKNPLYSAIYDGHKNVVELLVNRGIDISIKYSREIDGVVEEMDAYIFALERGKEEIAAYLKEELKKRGD